MTKLAEQLAALNIHNSHNLLTAFGDKGKDIAVRFTGADRGLGGFGSTTSVWSPSFQTDPGAPWYCHGNKSFSGGRRETWPLAMAWAIKRYGDLLWMPAPFRQGDYVPKYVMVRGKAAVKQHAKPKEE